MWSLSRHKRAFAAGTAALSLLLLPTTSSAEPGSYPGLPAGLPEVYEGSGRDVYGWTNAAQVGLAGSVVAEQWARIPLSMTALNIDFLTEDVNGDRSVIRGRYDNYAFLVPDVGTEANYGESAVIPVRTVAFGSIPTEVRLQVRQRRDSDDLPVGLHAPAVFTTYFGALWRQEYEPVVINERVEVAVVGLALDGVNVSLASSCGTGTSAQLNIASEALVVKNYLGETFDQDVGFSGVEGGTLSGTLDIPAFANCLTPEGDDLSEILTAAVSGGGNPVTVKLGILGCYPSGFDPETGAGLPASPAPFDPASAKCSKPQSEAVQDIPDPLPFPDHAPGAPAP